MFSCPVCVRPLLLCVCPSLPPSPHPCSIPLFLSVPYFVRSVVESGSSVGLYGFVGVTVAAVTIMGGTYAILPAYEVSAPRSLLWRV